MTELSRASHWLVLFLACLLAVSADSHPARANSINAGIPVDLGCSPKCVVVPATVFGGIADSIVNNRQNMIRFAFVGFGIGVLILVTATRKH
jgi:hypothetical protein